MKILPKLQLLFEAYTGHAELNDGVASRSYSFGDLTPACHIRDGQLPPVGLNYRVVSAGTVSVYDGSSGVDRLEIFLSYAFPIRAGSQVRILRIRTRWNRWLP